MTLTVAKLLVAMSDEWKGVEHW